MCQPLRQRHGLAAGRRRERINRGASRHRFMGFSAPDANVKWNKGQATESDELKYGMHLNGQNRRPVSQ